MEVLSFVSSDKRPSPGISNDDEMDGVQDKYMDADSATWDMQDSDGDPVEEASIDTETFSNVQQDKPMAELEVAEEAMLNTSNTQETKTPFSGDAKDEFSNPYERLQNPPNLKDAKGLIPTNQRNTSAQQQRRRQQRTPLSGGAKDTISNLRQGLQPQGLIPNLSNALGQLQTSFTGDGDDDDAFSNQSEGLQPQGLIPNLSNAFGQLQTSFTGDGDGDGDDAFSNQNQGLQQEQGTQILEDENGLKPNPSNDLDQLQQQTSFKGGAEDAFPNPNQGLQEQGTQILEAENGLTMNPSNTLNQQQMPFSGDAKDAFSNLNQGLQEQGTRILEDAKGLIPNTSNTLDQQQMPFSGDAKDAFSNLNQGLQEQGNRILEAAKGLVPNPSNTLDQLQQQQQKTPSLSNVSTTSHTNMSSNLSTSSSSSICVANSKQSTVYPPQQILGPGPTMDAATGEQQLPTQGQSQSGSEPALTPKEDAISLHSAFKGSGCDIGKVLTILAHRGAAHRALIKEQYKSLYSEDLITRLSSELGGKLKGGINEKLGVNMSLDPTGPLSQTFSKNLKIAAAHWMLEEAERDATIVGQGLVVLSSDLQAVTEVICSRTLSQILRLKRAYFAKYNSELADDINSLTSPVMGYHKELLVACLDFKARDEKMEVDPKKAEEDAIELYNAGEKRWGTDERTFIRIFTQRNRAHLLEVNSAYHRLYGHYLEKAVEDETSGNFQYGLLTLLSCAENPAKYFAMVLHKAMNATVKDNTTIIRVVVTRAEIDMKDIKVEYAKIYKESLMDAMHKKTSGHYRTFLLYIVDSCK